MEKYLEIIMRLEIRKNNLKWIKDMKKKHNIIIIVSNPDSKTVKVFLYSLIL